MSAYLSFGFPFSTLICFLLFQLILYYISCTYPMRLLCKQNQSPVPLTIPPSLSLVPRCAGTHNCVVSKKQISGERALLTEDFPAHNHLCVPASEIGASF